MKRCFVAMFFYSAITAFFLCAVPQDTTAINVKVYACRPDSGDCRRIIRENRLPDIPYDSVQSAYPVYIVILFNVQPPSGWAMSPEVVVGNERVEEYGSWGYESDIYYKIYCHSVLESSAGKTVLILPAYPDDDIQSCIFPDSATIDSIVSTAKSGVSSLPSIHEVGLETSAIGGYYVIVNTN